MLSIRSGFVEAKMRSFIRSLEENNNAHPHPLPYPYPLPDDEQLFGQCFYIGMQFTANKMVNGKMAEIHIDLTPSITSFMQVVKEFMKFEEGMDVAVTHLKASQLPENVFPDEKRFSI